LSSLFFVEPLFAYHHINAYEDKDGDVIVDIATCPCQNSTGMASCEHMNAFELRTLRNNSWPIPRNTFKRFYLPLGKDSKDKNVTSKILGMTSFDLPTVNPNYKGKKYKYVYGTGDRGQGVWWNTLVKVNVEN